MSWRMILLNLLHFVYVLHPPLPPSPPLHRLLRLIPPLPAVTLLIFSSSRTGTASRLRPCCCCLYSLRRHLAASAVALLARSCRYLRTIDICDTSHTTTLASTLPGATLCGCPSCPYLPLHTPPLCVT